MTRTAIRFICLMMLCIHGVEGICQNILISGTVLYRSGNPVAGATVEVKPQVAIGGILPNPVKTDTMGRFSISYPPVGEALLSASKVEEGYPDLDQSLYGNRAYLSLPKVNLTPGLPPLHVVLRLGSRYSAVTLAAIDAHTEKPIRNATLTAFLRGNDFMLSHPLSEGGLYTLDLPHSPMSLSITAPGYAEWKETIDESQYPIRAVELGPRVIAVRMTPSGR